MALQVTTSSSHWVIVNGHRDGGIGKPIPNQKYACISFEDICMVSMSGDNIFVYLFPKRKARDTARDDKHPSTYLLGGVPS